MKKILVGLIMLLSLGIVGCSSESKEPIEYEVSIYNLENPVNDLILEKMIISVNTDKLSNSEATKIVEDISNKDYSPRITFVGHESKLIAKSLVKEDDSIHIEFEDKKESKSNRDVINVTNETYYNMSVEKAKQKLNDEK